MILDKQQNTPVAAPAFSNSDALLAKYKAWSKNATATADELYTFMTTPSASRNVFLSTLSHAVSIKDNYIEQIVS